MGRITASFKSNIKVIVVTVIVTAAVVLGAIKTEEYYSSTRFCITCHSMAYPYTELKESVHYGSLGITPECGDCHMPPEFLPRVMVHVVSGVQDVYAEFRGTISTPEAYEQRRADLAHKARADIRRWGSSPCLACHKNPRPYSESGRLAHGGIIPGAGGCIDCHQNLAHKFVPPEEFSGGE